MRCSECRAGRNAVPAVVPAVAAACRDACPVRFPVEWSGPMPQRLCVSGGTMRGKKLASPPQETIRPASDRIRQAVFNILRPDMDGLPFFDVFAGTGIIGIEALSRGAGHVTFVEKDRLRIDLIGRNLAATRFTGQATVRSADAFEWARHFRPPEGPCVVFLGPPYPLFDSHPDEMAALVGDVQRVLADAVLVLQYPRQFAPGRLPDADACDRIKHYGKSSVIFWRYGDPEEPAAEEAPGADMPVGP